MPPSRWIQDGVSLFLRLLDVGFGVRLYGSTSGHVGVKAPAVAGSIDYTLPSASPTAANMILTGQPDGSLSWSAVSAVDFSSLPTVDPGIYGRVWRNATTGAVLMSLGVASYSPSLDFRDSRNSQYLPVL
jgi:hypothetical protein